MHSNLRVESFSCYLNSAEQNFALNLTRGISNSSSTVISPVDTPRLINLGTSMNNEASKYGLEKERSVELHQPDQNFRPKTSSITSEPSSLNCQSALLRLLCRKPSQRKHKKGLGTRLFPIFGCEGPFVSCVGKKAVSINERVDPELGVLHGIQQSQPGSKKVEQLTVPVLNSGIEIVKVKEQFEGKKIVQDDPRNSIEVFGSVMTQKGDIAVNMERKLSILRWDAIPKSQSLVTTTFGSSTMCDDIASDASSDLFEIENISGTGYPVLSRQESCNMPSCMSPTTQYAPSEASIEWSVVTASAADFSSVVSEYEGKIVSITGDTISKRATNKTTNHKDSGIKEAPKNGPNRLLGCRIHKTVRVAESTYKD